MQEEERPEIKAIEKQGKILADVMGRVVAPIVGLIAAGPLGGIAGGVVGTMIKYGIEDFLARFLTPKEVKRVGTSAEYIIKNMNDRIEAGSQINAAIFEAKEGRVSDAEELFEGVLLKTKNEYQEKKLKYISNIFVNAAFDPTISIENVNQILNIADGFTYRQLCLISLIGKNPNNEYRLREVDNRKDFKTIQTEELAFIIAELRTIQNLNLIHRKDNLGLQNFTDPAPAQFYLRRLGERIYQLMGLSEISDDEFTFIKELRK